MSSGQKVCPEVQRRRGVPEVPGGGGSVSQVAEGTASTKLRGWREAAWCWGLNLRVVALKLVLYPAWLKSKRFPKKRILE